jgi:DNA repair protein RecN (Recombination protein N)
MLKHLRIQNVILVEDASISFSNGLNILSGETGSGKSAIMHGLSLAIGERTDTSIIRKGAEKGIVEAVFDLDQQDLTDLLKEGGIDHEVGQDLIIRRELSLSGKSRVFINNQAAQLSFLRKIGQFLAQIVSQHANQSLYSIDYHRQVVDLFGDQLPLLSRFQHSYHQENLLRKRLEDLIKQESQRLREIDICKSELDELEEAQIKEGEDEELFAEYTFLINGEELSEQINEINLSLSGERQGIIMTLNRHKLQLDALVKFDAKLQETALTYQSALAELHEVAYTLRNYQNRLHYDANRLSEVNERLTLLNRLKRKYGFSVGEILGYLEQTKKRLVQLENADSEIEELKQQLSEAVCLTDRLSAELSEVRALSAKKLGDELTFQLHALNMPKAKFEIQVTQQKRTLDGDDRIEFFLHPNVGEHRIALKDGASGGEISRVLLALKRLLADKERPSSLIFDEVDANIGGATAAIIGEKLREISQQHQVICITHFPQVADCAHYHLQISKEERDGRTVTLIKELDAKSRQKELARMAGRR